MVVDKGVTEIADSEEEPLTSSPAAVLDAAVDKLSATARQEDQDPACNHQEPAGYIANQASGRADRLDADQRKALTDSRSRLTDENDLQPAQQAEGATVNTCTAKDVTRAASPPSQAIIDAVAMDKRDDCVAEHGAEGESRVISPDLGLAGRGDELCTPANVQAMINEAPYGQQSSHLPEALPLAPNSGIQVSPSGVSSQREAPCDDRTALGLVDGNQIGVQEDAVSDSAQNSTEQANSEATAESPGYDKAREAPIISQAASATNDAEIYPSSDHTASRDEKVVEALDSETSPFAAADVVLSSAQASPLKASTALPDLHAGVEDNIDVLPEPTTDTTSVSVPPSDIITNNDTDQHNFNHEDSLPVRSTTHDDAINVYTDHTGQQAKENGDCGTGPGQLTVDEEIPKKTQAGLPAEPSRVVHSEERISEPVAQESAMDVTLPHQDDAGTNSGQEMSSTQLESQRNSQSTASQPSEPVSPTKLTPQQITLAELKAQKAALLASLKDLPAIQLLIEESQSSDVDMSDDDGEPTEADVTAAANKIVKEHIKLLHEYNELKDVGQGLMGLIADQRGVRIVEVQDEFGIDAND